MIDLAIVPNIGATPIVFGMSRHDVHRVLGHPNVSGKDNDYWGARSEICVGYNDLNLVDHIGLGPGDYTLRMDHDVIWLPDSQPDPNPRFLTVDSQPLERLGLWCFTHLGVMTSGFHDNDLDQLAIIMYAPGTQDEFLSKASIADTSQYHDMH